MTTTKVTKTEFWGGSPDPEEVGRRLALMQIEKMSDWTDEQIEASDAERTRLFEAFQGALIEFGIESFNGGDLMEIARLRQVVKQAQIDYTLWPLTEDDLATEEDN